MLSIVKSPSNEIFYNLVENARESLYLCAPFIKKEIIDEILRRRSDSVDTVVITSSNISNFLNGSLDISAIKELINSGIMVRNYQNLHAKIYLFDNKKALITSANLTNNALYHNFEYGVLIEDEKAVVDQIYDDYIQMTCDDQCGTFDLALLDRLEKIKNNYIQRPVINLDEDNDTLIVVNDISKLINKMSSWQKDVFMCINRMESATFTANDIYQFENELKVLHPNNNNVKPKIRQILQQIRDMGFVKFTTRGIYKKLWICGSQGSSD